MKLFRLLVPCLSLASVLLKMGYLLHIRCLLVASFLLVFGVFQQEVSKKLATGKQGIRYQCATNQIDLSGPE